MIDWISTKVAMSLAALILLSGVVAFFLAQQNEARQDALQSIADRAAAYLDEVSRSAFETNTSMSLGPGGTLQLPGSVAGEGYSLIVYGPYVVTVLEGRRAFAVLQTPVHLWQPLAGNYTTDAVAELDTRYPSLTIGPGGMVIVSRRALDIDGGRALETFLFL